ncbi:MAG: hypothetical protein CMJ18_13725 [Phycisphaeraceae bacterium]|nr:hypothetical protein [Phycisphaeraceae bacterium]
MHPGEFVPSIADSLEPLADRVSVGFDAVSRDRDPRPFQPLGAVAGLFALYLVLVAWLDVVRRLPQSSYDQPVILFEIVLQSGKYLLLLLIAAVALRTRTLLQSWSTFDLPGPLRAFTFVTAFVAAWPYTTYDYNLFYGQGHDVDRIVVMLLAAGVLWRPVFVLPLLVALGAMLWQFWHPMEQYPWSHVNLPYRALILIAAAHLYHGIRGRFPSANLFFLVFCLVATHYWWGGLAKLWIGWVTHGQIWLMTLNAYANGWLAFLGTEAIVAYAKAAAPFDVPIRAGTVVLEVFVLACLWRRRVLLFFLAGWFLFHLGIFAMTGMFFWIWMVMEACLFVIVWRLKTPGALPIFSLRYFVISALLIGSARLWAGPPNLTWFDTPFCYTYRFHAIGVSGKAHPLANPDFEPYTPQFVLGYFRYIHDRPQLVHIWGATQNREIAKALRRADSVEAIYLLEEQKSWKKLEPARRDRFDAFFRRFIANLNRRRTGEHWLRPIQAPAHLWSYPKEAPFEWTEPIERIVVYRISTYFDGERYEEVRREKVHEIDVR